ncbi:ectoine/hydroxyectoine ABC transporter permease subunit EhuD [Kibdelosporangium philippinense]|uniref:Ectoine/hydroxyectoine ABC transporter permease subunit EhuD n=1 Tax=Kibdelosporangium philippinense TaxID=211113 RepID=A0ABS8ZKQ3_9PSEU|nr:ectoine/hydroxyectoine ABC transporter permease subunit EhuD [Kibdelosporangium philippinense]MCE7008034.1 ectoine/hydroxyectoine ABC transporter permease subunit EhuD [Kibdelosporangium philippinense]
MNFDWNYAFDILPQLLDGLLTALIATVVGYIVALVLGLVFALARRSHQRWISVPIGFIVEFIRGTPLLIQLFFLFFVLPQLGLALSPLAAGIIGLGLHYATYTSEVYRAGIEGVPPGQWDAAVALHLPRRRVWTSVILPQAVPRSIPALTNYSIALFKDVPQLVAITVAEPFTVGREIIADTFRPFEPITMAGLLYLAVALVLSYVGRIVERRFNGVAA